MPYNYDPEGKPEIDDQAFDEASRAGLKPIHVVCDDPDATVENHKAVSFWAFVDFIPRNGDRIELEDGRKFDVVRTYFKSVRRPGSELISLVPNVSARKVN